MVVQDINGVLAGMVQTSMPDPAGVVDGGVPGNSGGEAPVSVGLDSTLLVDFGYQETGREGGGTGVIGDTVFFDINRTTATI